MLTAIKDFYFHNHSHYAVGLFNWPTAMAMETDRDTSP